MASPIFNLLYAKKYVVQSRAGDSGWQDREAYKNLEEAKTAAQKVRRQRPKSKVRIFNRITGQVVRNYPAQSEE